MTRWQRFFVFVRNGIKFLYWSIRKLLGLKVTELSCAHGRIRSALKVTILGTEVEMLGSPMCRPCTEEYLNKYSTICAACKKPIVPGTPVGRAWVGASHPYTHLAFGCCATGGLYCGVWDEGRLLTLHDLDPERYPENTGTVAGHVMKTGETVFENVKN